MPNACRFRGPLPLKPNKKGEILMNEKNLRIVTRVTEKEFETIKRKAKKQVFRYRSLFVRRRSKPPTAHRLVPIMGSVASI